MAREISDDAWSVIDEALFAQHIIEAIRLVRAAGDCSLREAIDLVSARYNVLIAREPHRFVVGPNEYWAEFYS